MKRLFRIGGVRRDVDDELSFHFEAVVSELRAAGLSEAAARAEARRRFGDESRYRHELEDIDRAVAARRRWQNRLEVTVHAVKHAARALLRAPGLSAGIVLAFALGIGANATMFSVVERVLLRPPEHIVAPEQVRRVYADAYASFLGRRFATETLSYPDFEQMQRARSLESVAVYASRTMTVGSGMEAEQVPGVWAGGTFFDLLGVRPQLGRFYGEAEDRRGGERVVVISDRYWRTRFGSETRVLGETLDFGYGPYTIIGVAPRGFTGVDLGAVDVFLPFHVIAGQTQPDEIWSERHDQWLSVVVRTDPATIAQAEAEVTQLHRSLWQEDIAAGEYEDPRVLLASVIAARGPASGFAARGMVIEGEAAGNALARLLLAVAAIVLLIACVNVANLLLARMLRQRREVAVRLALGISRRRLIGQVLLEGLLLAAAGGAAAIVLAQYLGNPVRTLLAPEIPWEQLDLTRGVLMLVIGLALVAGVLSAIFPAMQAARGSVMDALRQAGGSNASRAASRTRAGLVLLQAALSMVLLVGAGLFVRSLDRVRHADLGFETDNLLYVVPRAQRDALTAADRMQLHEAAIRELAVVPGVRHVGASITLPFYSFQTRHFSIAGRDSVATPPTGGPYVHQVTHGYLDAMGLEVVRGRGLGANDVRGSERVAVVSETMARSLWPGGDALGACVRIGGKSDEENRTRPCTTIVGVVEDARRQSVRAEQTYQYYIPLEQRQVDSIPSLLVVRVASESPAVFSALRTRMMQLEPRLRWVEVAPMRDLIAPNLRSWEVGARMFSLFGVLALVVAAIGLYSVLAFDVAQRRRELGVRAALGASRDRLLGGVIRRALVVTGAGVAMGVLVAWPLAARIEPMLFETPGRDPVTFAAVALLLLLVAAGAGALPGWRAARTDPNVALRAD